MTLRCSTRKGGVLKLASSYMKTALVDFARNLLSPARLTLEMAEGVPIDPLLL